MITVSVTLRKIHPGLQMVVLGTNVYNVTLVQPTDYLILRHLNICSHENLLDERTLWIRHELLGMDQYTVCVLPCRKMVKQGSVCFWGQGVCARPTVPSQQRTQLLSTAVHPPCTLWRTRRTHAQNRRTITTVYDRTAGSELFRNYSIPLLHYAAHGVNGTVAEVSSQHLPHQLQKPRAEQQTTEERQSVRSEWCNE